MPDWLSHALAALGGVGGGLLPFLLRWKQQTAAEWQEIVGSQGERITALEARIEQLHADHVNCLQIQAELRAEIRLLKEAKP